MHIRTSSLLFLAVACLAIAPLSVGAQIPNASDMLSAEIVLKPKSPGPLTDVEARVKSFSLDSTRALITWRENGRVVQQARGGDTYSFRTGGIGSLIVLDVTLEALDGRTLSTSQTIRPAYVGLAWEAKTYTPPLYRGKTLQSPGSTLTFVALPVFIDASGKELDPDKLVYTWKQGAFPIQNASGYGKRTFTLTNSRYLETLRVGVEVSNMERTLIAQAELLAPVSQPEVLFYEQNPLLGIRYERAIPATYTMIGEEVTLMAEPYYFSIQQREDPLLTYEWRVDGAPVAAKGQMTLRPEGSGAGAAPVLLTLRHAKEILQSARGVLSVLFNTDEAARNEPSFFSL